MFDSLKKRISTRPSQGDSTGPPTVRAPYALPKGVPALQQDPQAMRRRLLFGIAFAALLAGGSGYLAGRRAKDPGSRSPEGSGATAKR